MSVQEGVAITFPEVRLRKTSPVVIFANSNLPEKRYCFCHSEDEIFDMTDDSTDLLKKCLIVI